LAKPITLAIFSDTHVNHIAALAHPDFVSEPRDTTMWIASRWQEFVNFVKREAKGSTLYCFHLGDAIDVNAKNRSYEYYTERRNDAVDHCVAVLEPMLDIAYRFFFMAGTAAHGGKSHVWERAVANLCAAKWEGVVTADRNDEYLWPFWYGRLGGVIMRFAHHAPMGTRPWTLANALHAHAIRVGVKYRDIDRPKLFVHGHIHTYVDTYKNARISGGQRIRAITLPGWQWSSEYLQRLAEYDGLPEVGGIVVKLDGKGNFEVKDWIREAERPRLWQETRRRKRKK
jgi:hypothetical protein